MPFLDPADPVHARVEGWLRDDVIIWLGTTRPDGRPHLVPVWFWWDGATLLIFSQPNTQKIVNLRHQNAVMLALDSRADGEQIAMLTGEAELPTEPMAEVVPPGFGEKYARLFAQSGQTLAGMAAEYTRTIRITPTKLIAW